MVEFVHLKLPCTTHDDIVIIVIGIFLLLTENISYANEVIARRTMFDPV